MGRIKSPRGGYRASSPVDASARRVLGFGVSVDSGSDFSGRSSSEDEGAALERRRRRSGLRNSGRGHSASPRSTRRHRLLSSSSDSEDEDTHAKAHGASWVRSHRDRGWTASREQPSGLGLGQLYRAPSRLDEQWPAPGPSGTGWWGCCCFEWDHSGEFTRRDVESVVGGLVDKRHGIEEKQGEHLLEQLRSIGILQKRAVLSLRKALVLDVVAFVSAGLVPLLVVALLHIGLSDEQICTQGSAEFVLLGLLTVALSILALCAHAIERLHGNRASGTLELMAVEEMKAEANQFIIGIGPYAKQRSSFAQLLLRLQALSSRLNESNESNASDLDHAKRHSGMGQRIPTSAVASA